MRLNFDDPPARGILSVEFVEAEYDANYVDAARPQTYCIVWVLEKIKWRPKLIGLLAVDATPFPS